MNREIIAKRYAIALYDFSNQRGELDVVIVQVQSFIDAYRQEPKLREAVASPRVGSEQISHFIAELSHRQSDSLSRFIGLVYEHRREDILYDIFLSFILWHKSQTGTCDATLEVAHEPDVQEIERLREILQKIVGGSIRFKVELNSDLIGGFRLRVEDLMIDSSLKSSLDRYRQHYSKPKNIMS